MKISTRIFHLKKSRRFIVDYNRRDRVNYKVWEGVKGIIVIIRRYIREHYLKQQRHRCAYCMVFNQSSHGLSWNIDHILPKDQYPQFLFHPLNLILSCKECNSFKTNHVPLINKAQRFNYKYPREGSIFSIVHPHFDNYGDHIIVEKIGNYNAYTYITDKGLETIVVCKLSRFSFIESYDTSDMDTISAIEEQTLVNDAFKSDPDFVEVPQEYLDEIKRRLHSRPLIIKKTTGFS